MAPRSPHRPARVPAAAGDERQRVLATLEEIPPGRVISYGRLAALAGLPRRARWVGRLLATLPDDSPLPWHRVVRADRTLAVREGAAAQERRLRQEGLRLDAKGRVPALVLWPGPEDDPLGRP